MDDHGSLWDMASADLVAERRSMRLTAAKVAVAEVWPFLALASNEAEFGHRLALADEHITAMVDADLRDEVIASLRENYRTVASSTPPPTRRKLDPDDPIEAQRIKQRRLDQAEDSGDDEGDREWDRRHKSSLTVSASLWDNLDEAPRRHQQHVAAADDEDDDRDEYGFSKKMKDQWDKDNPGRWDAYRNTQGRSHDSFGRWTEASLTFFHEGSGKWVTAAAEDSPGNPYYPDPTPEVGPNQGQSGPFTTADPPDRTLDQYQNAQRGNWQDRTPWAENPMNFSPPENGTSGWNLQRQTTQASRQRRTAKAPPMDPQDEETRAHVCKHCGQTEPDPTEPCRENGSYCSGCNGTGCGRCGHAGEVYGTHHLLVGVRRRVARAETIEDAYAAGQNARHSDGEYRDLHHRDAPPVHPQLVDAYHQGYESVGKQGSRRRAEVVAPEGPQNANPGYFDQGSEGITGPGAQTSPPPITGSPDAGVVGGGPDGTSTSEPIESRMDWYEDMTGAAGNGVQDGQRGQRFEPGSRRGASVTAKEDAPYRIKRSGDGWQVVNDDGDVKGTHDSQSGARQQQKAMYANVPGARESAEADERSKGKTGSFFDPHDASVRHVGADDSLSNPSQGADPNSPQPGDAGGGAGAGDPSSLNVPQDPGGGGAPSTPGGPGSNPNLMDVSTQAARRALAAGAAGVPAGGAAPAGGGSGGSGPPPPKSMTPGGPGAEAQPPMQQGAGAAGTAGGAAGNVPQSAHVPQSSKPRKTPGGPGGAPGAPGGAGATSGAAPAGAPKSARRVRADARDIATPDNPTGLGDEFDETANEGAMAQRPMQPRDQRKPNGPQNTKTRPPIPTISSPGIPGGGREEEGDDEEENTREAVRRSVARAMAVAR